MGLGAELVAPILVGAFVGTYLDRRFGYTPWLTVGGSILGVITGMVSFLRRALPPRGGTPPGPSGSAP